MSVAELEGALEALPQSETAPPMEHSSPEEGLLGRSSRHYDAVDEFNEISPQSPREVTMASRRSSVSRLSRRHSVGQSPVATTFVLGATSVSEPRNSSARLSQRRRSSVVSEPRLSPRRPSVVNSVVQNC